MLAVVNKPKLFQTKATTHLKLDDKKRIAAFIIDNYGILFKSYRQAHVAIKEHLGIEINFIGVRSIINSSYFKEMAFTD